MTRIKIGFLILTGIILITTFWYNPDKTDYALGQDKTYLKITSTTTESELIAIQDDFLKQENIKIDFSQSVFDQDGEIESLDLRVDCNDGNSGHLETSWLGLMVSNYGFSRNRNRNGEITFSMGGI